MKKQAYTRKRIKMFLELCLLHLDFKLIFKAQVHGQNNYPVENG